MNFSSLYIDLKINQSIEIDSKKVDFIYNFFKDKTPNNFICHSCNIERTFLVKDTSLFTIESDGNINRYKIVSLKLENDKLLYNDSSWGNTYNEISIYTSTDFILTKILTCPICNSKIIMIFKISNNTVTKIYTENRDEVFSNNEVLKYKKLKIMQSDSFDELIKANKCAKEMLYIRSIFIFKKSSRKYTK